MSEMALVKIVEKVAPYRNRKVSLVGLSIPGAVEHLREHLVSKEKRCEVGCMARFAYQRNSDSNRARVRRSARYIFRALLSVGEFLVIYYDPANHGRIEAMKLYEHGEDETKHALLQLHRMHRRKQLTDELFQAARALVQLG
jgi:hypothetical protein